MGHTKLAIFLVLSGWLFSATYSRAQNFSSDPVPTPIPKRATYVGDAICLTCHKDQSLFYKNTVHYLTSQPADKDSILGSFSDGSNVLVLNDPEVSGFQPKILFKMQKEKDGYFETAVTSHNSNVQTQSERIDIVIGSGVRGQTYLYWKNDALFELPASYWTDGHQWINSPGFRDSFANFSRPVYPRCLECHATYIRPLSPDPLTNLYDPRSLITGISCEICHGPGANHVAAENSKAGFSRPSKILNPAHFSRDRQVDLCALCHNGAERMEIAPAFSYVPGQPLNNYLKANPMEIVEHPDVHGDQVGLLKRSRCYIVSPKMTCSTCHDVHAPEKPAAEYSVHCLACHRVESCGMSKKMGHAIAKNCIDCHMPVERTNAILSMTDGKMVRASLRTHWIKVYPVTKQP